MQKIKKCLWFKKDSEKVAKYYLSIFKGKITGKMRANGNVVAVSFTILGEEFVAINGNPAENFNDSFSLMVLCKTQKEIDYYWKKLIANGGKESMCGWCKDKFGVSWQVAPADFQKLMKGPKAFEAMMTMRKLDIAKLKAAAKA